MFSHKAKFAAFALGVLSFAPAALACPAKTAVLTVGGYAGTSALANFPVAVRLSTARVSGFSYADCAAGGADVWFATDAKGANPVPHEVESWDTSGESVVWVRVPELSGTSTRLYMFWKDSLPPTNVTTEVWSEASYKGVWHMNANATVQPDSTATGNNATLASSPTYSLEAGKVGPALKKDVSLTAADFFAAANGGVNSAGYSVSGWFYAPDLVNVVSGKTCEVHPFAKGGWNVRSWYLYLKNTYTKLSQCYNNTTCWDVGTIPDIRTAWTMATFTYDNATMRIYVNGALLGTKAVAGMTAGTAVFGMEMSGWYDETRVRSAVSSADWIKAEYDSVNNADFVTAAAATDLAADSIYVDAVPVYAAASGANYGLRAGMTAGTSYTIAAPTFGGDADEALGYTCRGWQLHAADGSLVTSGSVASATFTYSASLQRANLTWLWEHTHYRLTLATTGNGGGTLTQQSQWVTNGGVVHVAVASTYTGSKFWKWTGDDVTVANRYRTTGVDVTMSGPKSLSAYFYDVAATPRIVRYVAPTASGSKDGTSWANAYGDLALGYNAVAANPSGGEVWLKKGRNWVNGAIAMVPRICVRGGFAGTETSADEANPTNNPTYLSHSNYRNGTEKWNDGTAMWTGDDKLTFVEPPDYGDSQIPLNANGTYGGGTAFENTDGGYLEDNEISGIDFFYFQKYAIKLTTRNVSPFRIRNCRFLVCGWCVHTTDATLWVSNIPVELTDNQFIACENTLRIVADTTVTTNILKGCRFYANDICWNSKNSPPRASGVAVGGTAYAHISGCWFEKCRNTTDSGQARAGAIAFQNRVSCLVEDTVVCRSYAGDGSWRNVRAAAVVICPATNNLRYTFARCRFERNTAWNLGCEAHNASACCIGGQGSYSCGLDIRDSYFSENVTTNTNNSNPNGNLVGLTTSWYGNFSNCTFENNRSVGRDSVFQFATSWLTGRYFSFANCVFRNNVTGYVKDGAFVRNPEFRCMGNQNESQGIAFVNCVFESDDSGYYPFKNDGWLNARTYFNFASCISSSSEGWGGTPKGAMRYQPLVNETYGPLRSDLKTNEVTVARGLMQNSVYRRKGIPVYRDKYGDLFIYDTAYNKSKPWRLLRSLATVYSETDAAARGLSRTAPIPDAFDRARKADCCALGPLNTPSMGFVYIVKPKPAD